MFLSTLLVIPVFGLQSKSIDHPSIYVIPSVLRSLTSGELSGHAVELEKRSMQLSLEEGNIYYLSNLIDLLDFFQICSYARNVLCCLVQNVRCFA